VQTDLSADQAMLSAARRTARRTPWMPLLSALLELGGGKGELIRHSERNWASVTFAGTRHSVVIAFTGAEAVAAGEAFIADAAIVAVDHTALPEPRLEVTAELLLLEDA
jgi:hypothetical protein